MSKPQFPIGLLPAAEMADRSLTIRPRPVYPRQLGRDDLALVLGPLDVLNSVIWAIHSAPGSVDTDQEFFAGLAGIVEEVSKDIRQMIEEDAEFERAQGGVR